ncbi:MAG: hypothetical protein AAB614_00510 [Patescibacteria group bacterium]
MTTEEKMRKNVKTIITLGIVVIIVFWGVAKYSSEEEDDLSQQKIKYLTMNCKDPKGLKLETLYPGDAVEVWHEIMPLTKDNQCSYAAPDKPGGPPHTVKIYGFNKYKQAGMKNSLLFPSLKPEAIILLLGDPNNTLGKYVVGSVKQFTQNGEKFVYENKTKKPLDLVAVPNYITHLFDPNQRGYDGSTITLGVRK